MEQVFLPAESRRRLLTLARQTLDGFVRGVTSEPSVSNDPYLQQCRHGAFVSLHARGELRGCVGICEPEFSLARTVADMTMAAAARDPRMKPVRAGELASLRIDISVLSLLETAPDPLALRPGEHGALVRQGRRRGVLLPQVAAEHHWDIVTFLEQTCRKAGLSKDAWQEPSTMVSGFTALVIEEE